MSSLDDLQKRKKAKFMKAMFFLPFNELNFILNDGVQNEENLNYSVPSQGHKKQ